LPQSVEPPSQPRSLSAETARTIRRGMLDRDHMISLCGHVERLRKQGCGEVPNFDPLDGGNRAQVLFLFEKPGPMTDERGRGSGFISRDNDDPTAEATFEFMRMAGIPRQLTAIWNVVPWWNGTRRISGSELRAGVAELRHLIERLPNLRSAVLVGRKAGRARSLLTTCGVRLFESAHPSPIVRATRRDVWSAIPGQWAEVGATLR